MFPPKGVDGSKNPFDEDGNKTSESGKDGAPTDPTKADSDGDGTNDGDELTGAENNGEPTDPNDPESKPVVPTPAPQGPADAGKCAASAVGFGLPLLALIPVGLATQMSIPGVSEFVENVSKDIERANAQIQRNLGTFNPQTAQALSQMNEQLRKAGFDLATVGAGIAVVAAGILAGTIIYDNCAPGGPKSSVKVDSLKGSSGKTWNSSKKEEK